MTRVKRVQKPLVKHLHLQAISDTLRASSLGATAVKKDVAADLMAEPQPSQSQASSEGGKSDRKAAQNASEYEV